MEAAQDGGPPNGVGQHGAYKMAEKAEQRLFLTLANRLFDRPGLRETPRPCVLELCCNLATATGIDTAEGLYRREVDKVVVLFNRLMDYRDPRGKDAANMADELFKLTPARYAAGAMMWVKAISGQSNSFAMHVVRHRSEELEAIDNDPHGVSHEFESIVLRPDTPLTYAVTATVSSYIKRMLQSHLNHAAEFCVEFAKARLGPQFRVVATEVDVPGASEPVGFVGLQRGHTRYSFLELENVPSLVNRKKID